MSTDQRQDDPADRRLFVVSAEEFDAFVKLLDEPPKDCPKLRALMARPVRFESES